MVADYSPASSSPTNPRRQCAATSKDLVKCVVPCSLPLHPRSDHFLPSTPRTSVELVSRPPILPRLDPSISAQVEQETVLRRVFAFVTYKTSDCASRALIECSPLTKYGKTHHVMAYSSKGTPWAGEEWERARKMPKDEPVVPISKVEDHDVIQRHSPQRLVDFPVPTSLSEAITQRAQLLRALARTRRDLEALPRRV